MHIRKCHVKKSVSSEISFKNLKQSFATLNIFLLTFSATFSAIFSFTLIKSISSRCMSENSKKSALTLKNRARTLFRISFRIFHYSLNFYMIMKNLFKKFKRVKRYTCDIKLNTRAFSAQIEL